MATFGKTYHSGNDDDWNTGQIVVSKFTLPVDGDISKLTVCFSTLDAAIKVIGCIYSDNAGVPNILQGQTNEVTGISDAWIDLPFAVALHLHAADFWLGWMCNGPYHYDFRDLLGAQKIDNVVYPNFSSPFVVDLARDREESVYGTYTPSVGVTVKKGSCVPAMTALLSKIIVLKQPREPRFQPRTFPKFTPRMLI